MRPQIFLTAACLLSDNSDADTNTNNLSSHKCLDQTLACLSTKNVPSTTLQTLDSPSSKQALTTSSTTQALVQTSSTTDANLHSEVHATPLAPRESIIPHYIPVPAVSPDAVKAHASMIRSLWPVPSMQAYLEAPDFCKLYSAIKQWNLPNFLGARITLQSDLNLNAWEEQLKEYHDREICYFFRYGWPIGYLATHPPPSVDDNHPSANLFTTHVSDFIKTELKFKALAGPFSADPFTPWTRLSPIMTRPKKDSSNRRIIIDLSFPLGKGVNQGINISSILGRDSTYSLPSIQDLVVHVQQKGKDSWLWKADLSRAYRQLRVDPLDTPLLALCHDKNTFLDLCPSFGCRSSSSSCQRMSAAVAYLMAKKGHTMLAYLDDYAGCEQTQEHAQQAYDDFKTLTNSLGLKLALDKCSAPATAIQWLGFDLDAPNMTLAIPSQKLNEVLDECRIWNNKTRALKRMIQSLIGKLLHLANAIPHARKFTSRILDSLRYMVTKQRDWTTINDEFKADVPWFLRYAEKGNGVSLFTPLREVITIECDSSLYAGGGCSATAYYAWQYPSSHTQRFQAIHHLEAVNILIAYKTLCPTTDTRSKSIFIYTDNIASSYALTSGKTKDKILASCARELWLLAATADHTISIEHRHGHSIPLADALSRKFFDHAKDLLATTLIRERNLVNVHPNVSDMFFFHDL